MFTSFKGPYVFAHKASLATRAMEPMSLSQLSDEELALDAQFVADGVVSHAPYGWSVVVGDGPRGRRIVGFSPLHPQDISDPAQDIAMPF